MIPYGANAIIKAREEKKRPAGMVLLTDGPLGLSKRFPDTPVVGVRDNVPIEGYDLRFLADLDVEIASKGDPQRSLRVIRAVLAHKPNFLRLWLVRPNLVLGIFEVGRTHVYRDLFAERNGDDEFTVPVKPQTVEERARAVVVVEWYRQRIRTCRGYPPCN